MKTLITMMNALKFYKREELLEGEALQEKLSEDLNRPKYHKVMEMIREKYFLNRS